MERQLRVGDHVVVLDVGHHLLVKVEVLLLEVVIQDLVELLRLFPQQACILRELVLFVFLTFSYKY